MLSALIVCGLAYLAYEAAGESVEREMREEVAKRGC